MKALIEKATGPDRKLDELIWEALAMPAEPDRYMMGDDCCIYQNVHIAGDPDWRPTHASLHARAFTSSVDAALWLCAKVLPGWTVSLDETRDTREPPPPIGSHYWTCMVEQPGGWDGTNGAIERSHKTPALALCLAIASASTTPK